MRDTALWQNKLVLLKEQKTQRAIVSLLGGQRGAECRGAQAETWVEVKQVMSQECSFYSQYGQQNLEGLGRVV